MLKTLGETTWDEIEVGEVFAIDSCWRILCKLSENRCFGLCWDYPNEFDTDHTRGEYEYGKKHYQNCLYKLPLSTQRLWRQD